MPSETIERSADLRALRICVRDFPVTVLYGPRQIGKTTLARQLGGDQHVICHAGMDASDVEHISEALRSMTGVAIIDDSDLCPEMLLGIGSAVDATPGLRVIAITDRFPEALTVPSSSPLSGRVGTHLLTGLTLDDVGVRNWRKLMFRGGFPSSYCAESDEQSVRWRQEYLGLKLPPGLPSRGAASPHVSVGLLQHIAATTGSLCSTADLARTLGVSVQSAAQYTEDLVQRGLLRAVPSWKPPSRNRRRQRKKLYVRDSGLVGTLVGIDAGPVSGSREHEYRLWESFCAEQLDRTVCHPCDATLYFWNSSRAQEVDFVWEHARELYAVEAKGHIPNAPPRGILALQGEHGVAQAWVMCRTGKMRDFGNGVTALTMVSIGRIARAMGGSSFSARNKRKVTATALPQGRRPKEAAEVVDGVPSKGEAHTVFISYSHRDSKFVMRLKKELEKREVGIVIDTETLRFGDDINDFIDASIAATDFTVMVVSEHSLRSPWVMAEFLRRMAQETVDGRRALMPITVDDCVFRDEAYIEITADIQEQIDRLNGLIQKAIEQNIYMGNCVSKRRRFLEVRNRLDEMLQRLNESLVADASKMKLAEVAEGLIHAMRGGMD